MKENWLALYLCILREVSISDAVKYMENGSRNERFNKGAGVRPKINEERKIIYFSDRKCRNVLSLREQNVKWSDIAKRYRMNVNTLKAKISKYKKRAAANEPTKVTYAACSHKKSITL